MAVIKIGEVITPIQESSILEVYISLKSLKNE